MDKYTGKDRLKEIFGYIKAALDKKADSSHKHTKSQITDFPTSMPASDVYSWAKASSKPTYTASEVGAAAASHGTHVTYSTTVPAANGTAAAGTAETVARSDHVHPSQTSVSGSAGSCTGNAATATKWATARNINGMSVQGDANRVNYGTCSTAAATAAKVVDCTGFALVTGAEITVKFTVTNTAASPTLNVNSTGAKSIYYRGSAITAGYLAANRTYTFRYNGTQYDLVGDIDTNTNTTYTNASLGQGYGTCATAAATAAKVVTLSSYELVTGGMVAVRFTYSVPASATLNINSKGAKAIYANNAAITAGIISAGDTALFVYDGSYYRLIAIDNAMKLTETELASILKG